MTADSAAKPSPVRLTGFGEDPLLSLAELVVGENRDTLPDLSGITILLPGLESAARLRHLLLESASRQGCPALLGPRIRTLRSWLGKHWPTPELLNSRRRELLLTEVLREHPQLYGKGQPWTLTRSLTELFDELTLHRGELPQEYAEFRALVASGYGTGAEIPEALSREATLIHTLWRAWRDQLDAEGALEASGAYLRQLAECAANPPPGERLYLAGFHTLSRAEAAWLGRMLQHSRTTLLLQGRIGGSGDADACHPDAIPARLLRQLALPASAISGGAVPPSALGTFLESAYRTNGVPMRQRAQRIASSCPDDPLAGRVLLFAACGRDQEARAVEIQVRRWLLEGCRQIGIVTDNRRLARQIRSLLEQGGVTLSDFAGWALSTTSAAASLERWLQTVEQEFDQLPLLDLLKSPFLLPDLPRARRLAAVYRLEQDIIRGGNIARGLQRYRRQIELRRNRLPHWTRQAATEVEALLDRLEDAARPLLPMLAGRHQVRELVAALRSSMALLGMEQALADDAAGSSVIHEIEQLSQAAEGSALAMSWGEFRSWLGSTLEHVNFRPPAAHDRVQLLSLAQTGLASFDAVVLAGAEKEYLPAAGVRSPFFNDSVRLELGLPTRQQNDATQFYLFRRLLQAAPRLLITLRSEQDGEPITPAPWVEILRTFYHLAYRRELPDGGLPGLVRHPAAMVFRCDTDILPAPPRRPAPAVPPELLPETISASTHQQLVDCPYLFFTANCLRLAAPEEIREELAKVDYGERVHRCLEAFHSDLDGLPGPFPDPLEHSGSAAAIDLLEQISRKVFARDLEDNFLHRGWLQQWLATIPYYVEWQIQRVADRFQLRRVEVAAEMESSALPCRLKGRIDRIDQGASGPAIVDYKTGRAATREEILRGESVQLPFYSLLAEAITGKTPERAEYLVLDSKGVKSQAPLEGAELREISAAVAQRLHAMLEQIRAGAELPAWGDDSCCRYCPMPGVCRRQGWLNREDDRQ